MIQEIKDFINKNIKENGKGGITGKILNSVLNKIADALPTSAGLKNLVDGAAKGSVRGVNAATETEEYKLGQYAMAEGCETKASGWEAHAEGYYTEAIDTAAHAEGWMTKAENCCHAEGISTQALNDYSHAEGAYSVADGDACHAEGYESKAKDYACHAEGSRTEASGEATHAEGWGCKSKQAYSHAEGYYTEATYSAAHAEGNYTKATNWACHAEGANTIASGNCSHAEGYYSQAKGYVSHAAGNNTIAIGDYQTAIGTCNKEIDALFSVGDGDWNDKRSDAFRVEKDSRVMVKNSAGEEVHLQDFEPRSCIIRWQPQSEIKDEMYFLYHDLVYMPMFDNLQDGERHILHLDWLYEHQVALDDAERTDGGSVEYIGGERLHSVLTVRKYAGNMYCELTTKVVETTRRNEDAHQNRFHTPQIRYNYADDRTHTRASRVYLQDYIFSERFNYDGENAVGTHFKLTLVSALLDGSPVPLTQFVFADNTGNVDYDRDEAGNGISNATSDGRYVYNADSVGDTDISVKVRVGDKTQTSKFTLNSVISDHEITIDVPEQEVSLSGKFTSSDNSVGITETEAGQIDFKAKGGGDVEWSDVLNAPSVYSGLGAPNGVGICNAQAWVDDACAIGTHLTKAEGAASLAAGDRCFASGDCSIALGFDCRTDGMGSVALGYQCTASADGQVVVGKKNSSKASVFSVGGGGTAGFDLMRIEEAGSIFFAMQDKEISLADLYNDIQAIKTQLGIE